MCGIVGYVGPRGCVDIIIAGLRKLEYRGYDSAGVAVIGPGGLAVARAKGKLRGKQPKHTTRQQRELVRMHNTGEYSKADLAELFTVSRATVYRVLERHRATAA